MATQAIRFVAPATGTITVDLTTLDSPTVVKQTGLACTQDANNPNIYTTETFTDTLAGRHAMAVKLDGTNIGNDMVSMRNASATYDAEGIGNVDGYSVEQSLKLLLAANAGKIADAGSTTNTFRSADDAISRIVATVDSSGNRSAITLDAD